MVHPVSRRDNWREFSTGCVNDESKSLCAVGNRVRLREHCCGSSDVHECVQAPDKHLQTHFSQEEFARTLWVTYSTVNRWEVIWRPSLRGTLRAEARVQLRLVRRHAAGDKSRNCYSKSEG